MILDWLPAAPALLVAAALFVLPGLAVTSVLGLRGILRWALAMPASLSIVVLAALVAPFVGLTWSLLPVLLVWLLVVVVAVTVRWAFRAQYATVSPRAKRSWPAPVALGVGGILILGQMILVVTSPENFSQTFDNVFHLNAIRYVLDTQNASPLHVGSLTSTSGQGGLWFYPSGWHALVALVAQLTAASVPLASNAVMIAAATIMWPASVVLLTIVLFGRGRALILAAGILAAGAPAFPLLMIDYGVLYPYFLAVCALPATIAVTLLALRMPADAGVPHSAAILLALGFLPGLAITHPGAFVAWLVATAAAAMFVWVHVLRARPARRTLVLSTAALLVFAVVAFAAWRVLKPPVEARGWPTTGTMGQAIGEAATMSLSGGMIALVVAVLMWVGVVVAVRGRDERSLYAIVMLVIFAGLYVAATALPWQTLRDLLTAAWYNNAPRLAALIPMFAVALASVGAVAVWRAALRALGTRVTARRPRIVVGVLAVALLIVGAQGGAIRHQILAAEFNYQITDTAPLISTDEMALIQKLPELVPEDALIAGNPWTGTALAYALADRRVMMPHLLMDITDDMTLINDDLTDAESNAAVCDAVIAEGVTHVLDFGGREVHGAEHPFPGLEDLEDSEAVALVYEIGDARLFQITACGL